MFTVDGESARHSVPNIGIYTKKFKFLCKV